jgi:hypothetical protein
MVRALLFALIVASILTIGLPASVAAGPSLEQRIATATGIDRTVDAGLQADARVRVREIVTDFSHDVKYPRAEVIAWNRGYEDPEAVVIKAWMGSDVHRAILTSREFVTIGCASLVTNETHWFVCILSRVGAAPNPPAPLPNTALEAPGAGMLIIILLIAAVVIAIAERHRR